MLQLESSFTKQAATSAASRLPCLAAHPLALPCRARLLEKRLKRDLPLLGLPLLRGVEALTGLFFLTPQKRAAPAA